jgi:hypothetical protein
MEQSLKRIRVSWGLLRSIAGLATFFTFLIIVAIFPTELGPFRIPALVAGLVVSALVAFKCNVMWGRISLILEVSLFSLPMISVLFSSEISEIFPALILGFVMILFSDHMVDLISNYGRQFSTMGERTLPDFNAPILGKSLKSLCRKLARNGAVFAGCYVITILVLLSGLSLSHLAPILSDVSLYVLVISISLAFLVTLKED